MKWVAYLENPTVRLTIQNDSQAGCYIYSKISDFDFRDDLQDTLEQAMSCANEYYGISRDAWKETEGKAGEWAAQSNNMGTLRCVIFKGKRAPADLHIYKGKKFLTNRSAKSFDAMKDLVEAQLKIPKHAWKSVNWFAQLFI